MKPSKEFLNTFFIVLLLATMSLVIFFWTQSPLANYNLQLVALLTIIFIVTKKITGHRFSAHPVSLTIFSAITLLLISETGGLGSPIFFAVYFLLFGAALLSSTPIVLALTLLIMIFFSSSLNTINAAIQLASLLLITPLAIFFGHQYLQLLNQQGEIILLKKANKDKEISLAKQETNVLIWLSLNLKNSLIEISENLSNLLSGSDRLTPEQNQSLTKAHQKIHQLLAESQNVKQLIDEETD